MGDRPGQQRGLRRALGAALAAGALAVEADSARRAGADRPLHAGRAARRTTRARKIGLLEKLVSIWEDELAQPARAMEEIEKILAIDPERRAAILALQRNAARAGDAKQLARALRPRPTSRAARAAAQAPPARRRRDRAPARRSRSGLGAGRPRARDRSGRPRRPPRAHPLLDERAGRYEEARRALLTLIQREPDERRGVQPLARGRGRSTSSASSDRTAPSRRTARRRGKRPATRCPGSRSRASSAQTGNYEKLVEVLSSLADEAQRPDDHARLLFQAAEVQELALGRDQDAAAPASPAPTRALAAGQHDPAILDAMERIHVRAGGAGFGVGLGAPVAQRPATGARASSLPGMSASR